jgi:thioredoxin-related protein
MDESVDGPARNDEALLEPIRYPSWFQLSFLNLREDLQQALRYKKRGLIVYFGQHDCPYCYALIEKNLKLPDVERYIRHYFDVVAVDIHGEESVTDMNGEEMSEREFADSLGVDLTPTLIFYDAGGKETMRLRGYYPPYKFRAALEYVADAHYREEGFRDYLERADPPLTFETGGLNEADFFSPPPYALDRSRLPAQQPLAVIFEQGDCHACDILHTVPLTNPEILRQLAGFESVQLDIWADTPVITPAGERTTSRAWAQQLGLFYTPSLLFFDEHGKEILRVDSVVGFYRLRKTLEYILSGAYRQGTPLPRYRRNERGEP